MISSGRRGRLEELYNFQEPETAVSFCGPNLNPTVAKVKHSSFVCQEWGGAKKAKGFPVNDMICHDLHNFWNRKQETKFLRQQSE